MDGGGAGKRRRAKKRWEEEEEEGGGRIGVRETDRCSAGGGLGPGKRVMGGGP